MGYQLYLEPKIDEKGNIENQVAQYQPNDKTKERLASLREAFLVADKIRNYPYREFGYKSLEDKITELQDRFINFVEPIDESDPSVAWRANTVRPLTRNKVLEVAAFITANLMYPRVVAVNKKNKESKAFSTLMEDVMQWANELSDYEMQTLFSVLGMLVFPGTFIEEGYVEYERDFKIIKEDGTFDIKKLVDEVYSGFHCETVPLEEIYIADAYAGKNIQRQPFIIRRRIISFADASIKYADNKNFEKYVRPGIRYFFDGVSTVYETQDNAINETQVEEITYYCRIADLELRIVNGVLMDDPDRPLQREDKKYPLAFSGYGLYDSGKFFYYKSMVDDLGPDQDAADKLINYLLDGTALQAIPSYALFGDDVIDRGVMIPGAITPLNQGTQLQNISPQGNLGLVSNVLQGIENNAASSSKQTVTQRDMTAYQTSRIEEEIKVKLGLFGRFLASLVKQFGDLRLPTIVSHLTMPKIAEISNSDAALEYATIVVKKSDKGLKDKVIMIDEDVPYDIENANEEEMQEVRDKYAKMSLDLLVEGSKEDKELIKVNPKAIRKLKYQCRISPDTLFRKSEDAQRAFALEFYDRAMLHPNSKKDSLLSLLVEQYEPGQEDKYIDKAMSMPQQGQPQQGGQGETMIPEQSKGANEIVRALGTPPKVREPKGSPEMII